MIVRGRTILASSVSHSLVLATFALILQRTGLASAPIEWDHAYFTVLAQLVRRGESIYANSFIGYPPLGPMISAAAMEIGAWFGAPSYLAPRYLAAGLAAVSAVLLRILVGRATGSAWAGLVAGLVLIGFEFLLFTTVTTLTPKVLVLVLTLVACLAVQARRWGVVGIASAFAASCWQPAALVPAALLAVVVSEAREGRPRALGAWAAGVAVGTLPAVAYLTATGGWVDLWQRAVVIPLASDLTVDRTNPLRWLEVALRQYPSDRPFFLAAGVGFLWFLGSSVRGGSHELLRRCLDPRFGGVPVLTLGWIVFSTLEFGAAPDMIPLLPLIAFWAAWLGHRLLAGRAVEKLAWSGLAATTAFFAFLNAPTFSWTLDKQEFVVRTIIDMAGPEGTLMAFSASEIYAIGERPPPERFLRLTDAFVPFLHLVGLDGCRGVLQKMSARQPDIVVVHLWRRSSDCENRIGDRLVEERYATRTIEPGGRIWHVYRRPWGKRMPSLP
jgi:hypothetical protein